jgi:hypothetical protein
VTKIPSVVLNVKVICDIWYGSMDLQQETVPKDLESV